MTTLIRRAGTALCLLATLVLLPHGLYAQTTPTTASESRIIDEWYLSPFQLAGTYADPLGSKIDFTAEDGPDGRKAGRLTYTLVQGGWCGLGRDIASDLSDLSRNTSFRFKAKAGEPMNVQMGLKDSYNVQYTASFQVPAGDWTQVVVPFSSFIRDPYYTPPDAIPGHPMDLTRVTNINFMPRTVGASVLELGTIEVIGTGGRFLDPEKGKRARPAGAAVTIGRTGGTPLSPFAFGNCYFDWLDWGHNGMTGLRGSEEAVKALHLDVLVGANNQNDANSPQLFDEAQEDKYIQYCHAVGAEPIMIVPVYGNNVDGGRMTAKIAADIVTYVNGTRKYGVKYWSIGDEVDIYDLFFNRKTDLPVSTVSQYAAVYNSYAKAMVEANERCKSGVQLKFVGPELGARYMEGNDWLSPMLDACKDYIDVVSIHVYGFAARQLSAEGVLGDNRGFPWLVRNVKDRIARHAKPGTALAITEANVCYDAFPNLYTPQTRKVGPGTFYAALWDADHRGMALEEDLWTYAFWDLAESVQGADGSAFGFVQTDATKDPPVCRLTPEYYADQMVTTNFSGTTVKPSAAPEGMSVYASYDPKKAATAVLVLNKDSVKRTLTLAVDGLKARRIDYPPMSINLVTFPDVPSAGYQRVEYTKEMADAGLPPRTVR